MYERSDKSSDIRWIAVDEIKILLDKDPDRFFPMHINALKKYFEKLELNSNKFI